MCGIWGFVGRDTTIPVAEAWRGLESLVDRGPDDWGVYTSEHGKVTDEHALTDVDVEVFLGNRRLSILDLSSAGNQPMTVKDGSQWLVYNGEVYNYVELRETLRSRGYEFHSDCDTEVVLRAYQEFGSDCVEHFRGMFAFAVLDEEEGELFAARDRFGIKPFYYTVDDDRLAFASQLTALLKGGVSEEELDSVGVRGYLQFGFVPSPSTIVDDIQLLAPGTTLTYSIESGEVHLDQYWSPTFDESEGIVPDRLREILAESVQLRLRSDVPVGAFLSGGLDSSALVALMSGASRGFSEAELHTFTIGFEEEEYSELDYAAEVADYFETDHATDIVTGADLRRHLPEIIAAMDQPMIDGLNTYFVSKLAREEGVRVALSGAGADELLWGYPTFERTPILARIHSVMRVLPHGVRRLFGDAVEQAGSAVPLLTGGKNPRKLGDIIRSDSGFGALYRATRGLTSASRVEDWLGAAETGEVVNIIDEAFSDQVKGGIRDGVSFAELRWFMHDDILLSTDTMSMANSLEVRLPFLDSKFTNYVTESDSSSVDERTEKEPLRSAMRDILPGEIADREKKGFSFPLGHWLQDELKPVVDNALSEAKLKQTPLVYEVIETDREKFETGDLHSYQLWTLVVLSLWIDEHLTSGANGSPTRENVVVDGHSR